MANLINGIVFYKFRNYPRVFFTADLAYLVYEFGAYNYLRTSTDGLNWTPFGTYSRHLDLDLALWTLPSGGADRPPSPRLLRI